MRLNLSLRHFKKVIYFEENYLYDDGYFITSSLRSTILPKNYEIYYPICLLNYRTCFQNYETFL
jgi:hypothetical protein